MAYNRKILVLTSVGGSNFSSTRYAIHSFFTTPETAFSSPLPFGGTILIQGVNTIYNSGLGSDQQQYYIVKNTSIFLLVDYDGVPANYGAKNTVGTIAFNENDVVSIRHTDSATTHNFSSSQIIIGTYST